MYKILGIQSVDYTNKSGNRVSGVRLHCTYEDKRVTGYAVESIFVSSSVSTDKFEVGDEIDVLYNKYGSVSRVIPFN